MPRPLGLDRDPFVPDPDAPLLGDRVNPTQARDWILDCLAWAGGSEALIAPGALSALGYAADGSAVRLRQLASAALRQAGETGATRIEMGHARRAIAGEDEVPAVPLVLGQALEAGPAPPAIEPVAIVEVPREPVAPVPVAEEIVVAEPEPVEELPPPPVANDDERWAAPPPRRSRWGVVSLVGASAAAGAVAVLLLRPVPITDLPATVLADEPVAAVADAPVPAPVPEPVPEEVAVAEAPMVTAPEPVVEAPEPVVVAERPTPAIVAPPPKPSAPQIVLRYASDQPGAAEAASRVAALLRARGHDVSAVRAASGRVRQASVRYADGEQAAADAVNDAFEGLLRAYQPNVASLAIAGDTAPGTIELWLPDSAATAARPLRTDVPPV